MLIPGASRCIPFEQRFWAQVVKQPNGCWEWQGHLIFGYGYIRRDYTRIRAHRASLIIHGFHVPDGAPVCHRCDNRRCVNPDHLYVGTHSQNIADRNTRNPRYKIGADGIRQAWQMKKSGSRNVEIAKHLGVSANVISTLFTGKTYKQFNQKELEDAKVSQ